MNKNICIITTVDITLKEFVIPSAREMQKNGFTVTLLSSMSNNFIDEFSNEFRLINIPFERGANFIGMLKGILILSKIFRNEKFHIVQYATPNASFYASIAGFFNKVPARVYCQWGIRYVGFNGLTRKLFKLIERITCSLSTHIRPASSKNMEFAISEHLYKPKKAGVIGAGGAVGIDLKVFDIKKKEVFKQEIQIKHPQLNKKLVFGFVGRLDKDKGVNELIEAFREFNVKNKNSCLLIIGPKEDNAGITKDLMDYSNSCEDIIFTGFSNEIPKYLSALDILLHPSYREGFSLVIQQAMAMGVPVITTNIPGPSEVIEENISGLLANPKDSVSLCMAMNELALNKEKQLLFAENGLARVKDLFTQQRMSKLILEDRQHIFETIS